MVTATATATRRAVGYFRVSTTEQAGERHASLPTQESSFLSYCQKNKLTSVGTFTDMATGRKDDRQAYKKMLDFVRSGGADVIIVKYLDRFGRNPREILRRYWELEERNVTIVATDEDLREELQVLIRAFMAGHESKRNSERVRAYMPKAIAKGMHVGRSPYGLRPSKHVGKDGGVTVVWEVNPEEAEVVRAMYALAVDHNLGYKAIGDRLTDMGYLGREGHPFASYTVEHVLRSETLVGNLVYGKKPRKTNPQPEIVRIDGFFPAILTPDEWKHLQDRLNIRRENPRGRSHVSDYLLSGIVRCGYCGGPMVGKAGALRKGKRYRNYFCSQAQRSKALCSTYNGHSAPKLEKEILEYLGQYSDPKKVANLIDTNQGQDAGRIQAEFESIEKQLKELDGQFLKDIAWHDQGILNESEFVKVNTLRRSKVDALQARKTELESKINADRSMSTMVERIPEAVNSFFNDFHRLDIRQQKARLQTILKAAHVYRDGRIELEFRG